MSKTLVKIKEDHQTTRQRYNTDGNNVMVAPRGLGSSFLSEEERSLADGQGRPNRCWMAVEFQQIFDIDIKAESFAFEILIKLVWRCPNVEAEHAFQMGGDSLQLGSRGVGLDTSWEPDWLPRVKMWYVSEELTDRSSHCIAQKFADAGDDEVWITRWTTFCCRTHKAFNLRAFPFDSQFLVCRIEVDNVEEVRPLVDSVRTHAVRCIKAGVAATPAFVLLPDEPANGSAPVVYKMIRNELIVNFLYRRVWEYHVFNEYLVTTPGLSTLQD